MPGKLGRPTEHRNAMLRGLVTYLLENGSIETTLARAKQVRSMAEKMITLGKKNTLASRRAALAYITKEDVVSKLFNEIAPKYEGRNGGYTQIFKTFLIIPKKKRFEKGNLRFFRHIFQICPQTSQIGV